ncbi:nucleoside hydrolase [Aureispira anguillae]|uniref:Nucleoside hydrolase n=1 Tax=Aureispira anguillae TaxID=2864201 RepID=A0A916DQM5_9BACT|nr:nucleoside hydrolase [Aureispira anguillae]BDS09792.1 nucleoside hydrolase [Aureispira anguillae]
MMKELVLMDHDGGIDDLLSVLLLLLMPKIELIGITVTPADCYLEPAIESTYKLLQKTGKEHIPIGRGVFHGVNAFPSEWRARPEIVNVLPMLINLPPAPNPYDLPLAVDLMIELLHKASQPVKIVMTGPCSNLVLAIEKDPTIISKIKEIIWMGGAFRTSGNVQTYQHNGTAEWNVYWDPFHAQKLLELELPLVMVPLDVTNHVPVDKAFLSKLAQQSKYELSNLAAQLWALTIDNIPSYHYIYYMWDILATSYVALEAFFTVEELRAKVLVQPPNAGQTLIHDSGHRVRIATDVNKAVFYEYLFSQFKADFD